MHGVRPQYLTTLWNFLKGKPLQLMKEDADRVQKLGEESKNLPLRSMHYFRNSLSLVIPWC
jgi:hypothetical protein